MKGWNIQMITTCRVQMQTLFRESNIDLVGRRSRAKMEAKYEMTDMQIAWCGLQIIQCEQDLFVLKGRVVVDFFYWLWTLQYMRNAMVGLGEISSEMWNWKSLQCVRPSILGQWVKQEPEMLFRTPIAATTSQSWVTQTNAVRIKIKWNWCHTTYNLYRK